MFKHILVPIDGSELSDATIRQACSFARETGARLTFYYARPNYFPAYISGEVVLGGAGIDEALLAAMEERAKKLLQDAGRTASEAGVRFDTLSSEFDSPYAGIIAAAESQACDLIFMASHGRRGASALLLGSETQKVLTHCRIPVLVYR